MPRPTPTPRLRLVTLALGALVATTAAGCAESGGGSTAGGGSSSQAGSAAAGGGSGSTIKMGAVLDITGAGASLGVPERQTLELLTEQVNAKGGVGGKRIELIIEDNQSDEARAAQAMTKLVTQDKVDIVLGASRTGPSLAMVPIATQNSIPMISLAANAKIVDGQKWVFKTAQNDQVVLEKMVDLAKEKGWKKIAMARDASAFGEGVQETFNTIGKADGISITTAEKFDPGATDFTAQMVNMRNANADANLIWGIPPAAALAQKAYQQLNLSKPVLQSHGIGNKVFLDTAGSSADGLLAPLGRLVVADQLPADDPQKQVITEFKKAYQDKYGQQPSTFAGHAQDAFQLAVKALGAVGTDKAKVRDYLETAEYVGVSGVFKMTPQDHSGLSKDALVVATVQGGQFKLAEKS